MPDEYETCRGDCRTEVTATTDFTVEKSRVVSKTPTGDAHFR